MGQGRKVREVEKGEEERKRGKGNKKVERG